MTMQQQHSGEPETTYAAGSHRAERKRVMKKFLKGVMGIASVAVVTAGIYYCAKKWFEEKDEELEEDFDDFDLDEDDDSREYVTLDIEDDEIEEDSKVEDVPITDTVQDSLTEEQ